MDQKFGDVVGALISERAYQDQKWDDKETKLQDYITYIQKYVGLFDPTWTDAEILDNFRKVTALGVAAMEKFGAPQREGYKCEFIVTSTEELKLSPDTSLDDGCPHCDEEKCDYIPYGFVKLTPEELDALVKDGQVVKVIERGIWYRVNETKRTYVFDTPAETCGSEHHFTKVRAFAVMPSGGHRLIDDEGTGYYVQPGWRTLIVHDLETV